MPWTSAQVKLFHAAAHNPSIAKQHGMTPDKARQMASEGVRNAQAPRKASPKVYAQALGRMR